MASRLVVALGLLAASAAGAAEGEPLRLGLDETVRRALARHPSPAIAAQEIERARGVARQVAAAALPTLVATGSYTRLDADRSLADRVIAGANQISANVSLQVPLVAASRWAAWAHANDQVEVARQSAAEARRQLALTAARTWLTALSLGRLVEIGVRAEDQARGHLEFARTRRQGGAGNRLDELRAEQEVAAARAQRAAAEANLGKAEESLGLLVASDGPVGALLDPPPPPPPLDEALAGADHRQDVRTAQARLGAARNLVRDGWTDYLPILVGSFAPFYQNPPSLVQPLTGWQAQLVLSLPLYDGGLRYGLRRERAAVAEQARVSLEGTLRQARAEVRSAALALRHGDEALAAARDSARLAEEARALAELAYRAGATTSLELFDAERRARDAATQATLAEDAARQARLDLLAAGGRWP